MTPRTASTISGRIHPLSAVVIDKIAAGEVIEGPFSVIKELMENSIDAGATRIRISTYSGGVEKIIIEDNGVGFYFDDLPLGVERHATSKISELEDIEKIGSFGFRGEALATIAAVSHLIIKTKRKEENFGGTLECRGGEVLLHEVNSHPEGTTLIISDLFYSTPARKKFLKAARSEDRKINREIIKIAIANPEIQIIYQRDDKEILSLQKTNDRKMRICDIYDKNLIDHLIEIKNESGNLRLSGYIADENYYRGNRDLQIQYVNGRHVELKYFSHLVKRAYGDTLPSGVQPCFFLFIDIPPEEVDCNVHPAKREVRLKDESILNSFIIRSISSALHKDEPLSFSKLNRSVSGNFSENFEESNPLYFENSSTNSSHPPQTSHISQTIFNSMPEHPPGKSEAFQMKTENVSEPISGQKSFIPLRHFGLLLGTYILAEGEDSLYIIDQHTAHERINYEKIRKNLDALKNRRQRLLVPITIECSEEEVEEIQEKNSLIEECGFQVEPFGKNSIIVREVPEYFDSSAAQETLFHVISRLMDGEDRIRVYDEYAALKACRASIKKNDRIAGDAISEILFDLSRCDDPSRCPHGRPTMVKISREDLDRLFGRI